MSRRRSAAFVLGATAAVLAAAACASFEADEAPLPSGDAGTDGPEPTVTDGAREAASPPLDGAMPRPAFGIRCKGTSCDAGVCCLSRTTPDEFACRLGESCGAGFATFRCDDVTDCPAGSRCCAEWSSNVHVDSVCQTSCSPTQHELCNLESTGGCGVGTCRSSQDYAFCE